MTNTYSINEYTELLILYFRNGENYSRAARSFHDYHPDRPAPRHTTVIRLVDRFMETGNVAEKKRSGRRRTATSEEKTVDVIASIATTPTLSLRDRGEAAGISKDSVHRILKKAKIRPYRTHFVQQLHPNDGHRRLEFCHWASGKIDEDPSFTKRIIFTDESTFVRHGQVSTHWTYHWADTNPHVVAEAHTQHLQKLNVWCGIWDDTIIGPFFIQGNLNGQRYRDLLEQQVWPQLEPLLDANADVDPYFMQDGAPAHSAQIAKHWLDENFPNRWIGTYGPVAWLARSPDLTPMDFFLWGYLKNLVYPVDTIEDLQERITTNLQNISTETLLSVQQSWSEKLDLCIAVDGSHFEQL